MNPVLLAFSLSLFLLTLLVLEGLGRGWDHFFGVRRQLRRRLAQWEQEPAPLAPVPPPTRTPHPVPAWWQIHLAPLQRIIGRRRLHHLEAQLPEAIDFISRALRAGHDLPHAIEIAAAELPPPIAGELRLTAEEIGFGAGLPLALQHLGKRMPIRDLHTFIMAATLHRETGGDITRVFDRLANLIRERAALRAQIRTLSSEGRLSAWILSILPLFCAIMVHLIHPGLLALLTHDPAGRWVVAAAFLFWVCGLLIMKHITRLEP